MNTSPNTPTYQVNQPTSMLALAGELTNFIKSQNLSKRINGKEYVFCEGWTYAGSALGILPAVVSCENIGTDGEIKYKVCVELINISNGMTVGRAFAICSNQESGKRNYAEFAIASTAMTRATGKAYRLPLGWLMKCAGYESCNAEEMDYDQLAPTEVKAEMRPTPPPPPPPDDQPEAPKMASVKQKQELLLLLNHQAVSKEEKEKMIEGLPKMTAERTDEAIKKLKHRIRKFEVANH